VELHRIALRCVFAYVVLLALLRASGKRTVAQGTPFDFVLALVLGDMIDDLLWADVSAARFTVAVGTLTFVHTLVAVACGWSERFERLVAGSPSPVLEAGHPRSDAPRGERISQKELALMLRLDGVAREQWPEVRCATIEVSGQPSVRREPWAEPAQKRDLARIKEGRP
jgi:uncharacterized membrane protein YcaP (DUF421 family)